MAVTSFIVSVSRFAQRSGASFRDLLQENRFAAGIMRGWNACDGRDHIGISTENHGRRKLEHFLEKWTPKGGHARLRGLWVFPTEMRQHRL